MISPSCFKTIRLLLPLICLPMAGLLASSESYVQILTGHLKKGDSLTVIDDKFLNLPLSEWNQLKHISIDNIISFELRQDTSLDYYSKTFSCTLNITIKYFTSRDQQTPKEIDNIDLVVKYDTARGKSYPLVARYKFKDAFKVTVVVNSISSPEWKDKLPDVFRLKNQVLVERKYPFDPGTKGQLHLGEAQFPGRSDQLAISGPQAPQQMSYGLQAVDGKLPISWNVSEFGGAEEYDVEWTYIDKLSGRGLAIQNNYGGQQGPLDIPDGTVEQWMVHDNTRVTVTAPPYTINLPYTEGYILVRIRKVSYQSGTNLRVTGDWVYRDDNGVTAGVYINAHQSNLNWQYDGSFAEEGKRKEVITYFDGTLRNRQSVTLSNSDHTVQNGTVSTTGTAIVQETIYDVMGRPAMNILPAPVKNNTLDYYASFNLNHANSPYSSSDIGFGNANSCALTADLLSTSAGASQYYSPGNTFLAADNGANVNYNTTNFYFTKYVPDAETYPYALTEYTPDNTGRIRRQGGVGKLLQIGQQHETNYYYGKPTSTQLERLFGMEVGNSSHYLKNMVVDPNGQISVSYIDANGRTIATALAGNVPPNLAALPSSQAGDANTPFNETLIKPADFSPNSTALNMTASSTFLAEVTGNFTLHYSINPLALVTQYGGSSQLCNNCYYTVNVQVSNDCGIVVANAVSTPFQGNDYTCYVNPAPVSQDLAIPINKIGEYTVTYSLQLSNDVINAQTDYYIQHNTDLKKLQDFFIQELQALDLSGCYNTCDACKSLGTSVDDFRSKVVALLGSGTFTGVDAGDASSPVGIWIGQAWTALKAHCDVLSCAPASPCAQKLSQLKTDVLPGGQYALYDATALANGNTTVFLETAINVMMYYNQDNAISTISFVGDDGVTRTVGSLSQADFLNAYLKHPEWADLFVVHHIEYCSYQWCTYQSSTTPSQNNEVSYIFDANLKENYTAGADAVNMGYYNHGDPLALLKKDPFFNGGMGSSWYSNMQSDLQKLSTVMGVVPTDNTTSPATALPAKNIIQWVDWMLYCKPTVQNPTAAQVTASWQSCAPSNNCRSVTMEWQLYLNYYQQVKSKYYRIAKLQYNPSCLDCFIGNDALTGGSNNCPPPGALSDYSVVERLENSTDYNFYIVYKNGTAPFIGDYTFTYDIRYNIPGTPVVVQPTTLTAHAGDMQVLIQSFHVTPPAILGLNYSFEVYNVACTPSGLTACANNAGNITPPSCPAASEFSLQQRNFNYPNTPDVHTENCRIWYYQEYLVHSGGPVATDVQVKVSGVVSVLPVVFGGGGSSSTPVEYIVTIPAGQSEAPLGQFFEFDLAPGGANPQTACPTLQYSFSMENVPPVCVLPVPSPSSLCTSNPNYALYQSKDRVFNDYIDMQDYVVCERNSANASTQAQSTAQSVAAMLQAAMDNLTTQQAAWLSMLTSVRDQEFPSLSSSTLSNTVLTNLAGNLAQVSAAYLQYASQQGVSLNIVSTLPAGVTASNGYHSFSEVFTAIVGSSLVQQGFSPDLLSNVYPYDKVPYSTDPNVTSLTPDIYTNIGPNLTAFQSAWNGSGTFSSYLQQQLGDDYLLTDAQLSDLQARIAGGCANPYLANPAILPVAFVVPNPGSGSTGVVSYKTCSQVAVLATAFTGVYPNVQPDTKLYRLLYTNYLNHQLGYPLSYSDYADYATQCPLNAAVLLYDKPQSPTLLNDFFSCSANLLQGVYYKSGQEYTLYINEVRATFRNAYISKCLSNQASAKVQGNQYEYHYTLYYYDQSGNLVKTVPPEGVHLLSDQQIADVEQLPVQDPSSCPVFPSGIVTDQPTIFNDLSTALQNNTALSMEMWLYSTDGTSTRQLRIVTPDNKYMYQVAIVSSRIWVEMYSLQPDPSGAGTTLTLTNQVVANLPSRQSLQNWTHLVVQSPDGLAGGNLQVYLDGIKLTLLPDVSAPPYPFGWEIDGSSSTLPTADVSIIRHLRLYNRVASDAEIAADYRNSCLGPIGALTGTPLQLWGRLGIPSFCSNTVSSLTAVTIPNRGSLNTTANPNPAGDNLLAALRSVTNTFTVEFWVNPTAPDVALAGEATDLYAGTHGLHYVISPFWGGYAATGLAGMGVSVGTNGVTVVEHADYYVPAVLIWRGAISGWTHVAVVYNNKTPSLYINGVYQMTGATSVKTYVSPSYNLGGGGYGFMPGGLDEVRIWSTARTVGQLAASYAKTLSTSDQDGLMGYWPMDGSSGSVIKDISCNNNNDNFVAPAESWVTTGAPLTEINYVEYAGRFIVPDHGLATNYAYNSLNQVVQQHTPDAGTSVFAYDRLGRLSVSQNAEQLQPAVVDANNPANRASYTRYDALGRITEVGEKVGVTIPAEELARLDNFLGTWMNSGVNRQVTLTAYDEKPSWAPAGLVQSNLRKRVAASALLSAGNDASVNRQAASYYNYDIDGNVSEQVQENATLVNSEKQFVTNSDGLKHIKYEYDLISGKVNKVLYQDGKWDQFYYQYIYDADNRVINALSSRSNYGEIGLWTNEATYRYYLHGPLARMELGQSKVQGVDYAYTLQGWLKGVNGVGVPGTSTTVTDMSADGMNLTGGANPFLPVGRDAVGYSLGYFADDYYAIGGINASVFSMIYIGKAIVGGPVYPATSLSYLYNGNIGNATYAISPLEGGIPVGYRYFYDQLNRLTGMDRYHIDGRVWDADPISNYGERISYDANGNILTYLRSGTTANSRPLAMDNLTYNYNRDVNGHLLNNKLRHINDAVPAGNYPAQEGDPQDIDDQPAENYTYDAIGNLVADQTQNLKRINWTVYGKMASISKGGSQGLGYAYDPGGNRITKTSTVADGTSTTTHYVRDAQGNVLAVYQYKANAGGTLTEGDWAEQHLYGSSRLGMLLPHVVIPSSQKLTSDAYNGTNDHTEDAGNRLYELTNHLGNTLATISDKLIPLAPVGGVTTFSADVVSAQDYYPFGMQMPGRSYLAAGSLNYRYGFNGKEKNDEISGPGNTIDFGNRMDDTRGGRWFSIDRITKPWLSPYAYAADNPVNNVDPDGKDEIHFHFYTSSVIGPDGKVMGGPTTFTAEIIKANGPDKFFVHTHSDVIRMPTNYSHGGQATQEKTVEIYPWNPDSRSGFTKSTALGIPVNDRDYATLMKYATANPALKEYIKERSQGYEATNYDKENYKGLLEDLPVYNAIGKIKQGAELTAGILSIVEGGYGLLKAGGIEADISVLSSAGGNSARMSVVRTIAKGEKIDDLMNDLKGLTFTTGNEHAVVTLANGERAIVSGGPGGITFEQGQIRTLFGHTHPTSAPPSSADAKALTQLGQSKQYVLHGGEITTVRPK